MPKRAGKKIKTTCRMLINCTLPAINYSTCCGGEANVLMHHNGQVYDQCRIRNNKTIKI